MWKGAAEALNAEPDHDQGGRRDHQRRVGERGVAQVRADLGEAVEPAAPNRNASP